MKNRMKVSLITARVLALLIVMLGIGCGGNAADAVQVMGDAQSHLSGTITLSAEIDSLGNHSGFSVLVADLSAGVIDTLGFAVTDTSGHFAMDLTAPEPGIYSLVIGRDGSVLRAGQDEIVIANGDSASLQVEFPFTNRPIMIRSVENAALLGFKNSLAIHNNAISDMTEAGEQDLNAYGNRIRQTAEILWGLQDNMAGTIGAELAAAQSVIMLEEWNDSLIVARARSIKPGTMNYARVVEVSRRAQLRVEGPEASIALLNEYQDKTDDPGIGVMLQSELVLAYRDNGQREEAIEAANVMKTEYQDSTWFTWADRALYDLEVLWPGEPAPAFRLTDIEGAILTPETFRGKDFILEFYIPSQEFGQQLTARGEFYRADGEGSFEIVSVSLQPDPLLNEAFREGRDFPGKHVVLEDGPDAPIVTDYNINLLPTRFLVDQDGNIIGKYVLENGALAYQDALTRSINKE